MAAANRQTLKVRTQPALVGGSAEVIYFVLDY
jgi:hypothetical protein